MNKNTINLKNIDKARAYFKEKKPEVFPLTGHPLAKEDIYVKEIYVSLLCSIAAYDGEIAESEMIFIKRVINGLELNTKFEQLVKNGLEISNRLVDDFIKAFSGKEYAFNFITDALMLAVSDGKLHDKEIELISEISELLKVKKQDIEEISKLISVLMLQSQEELSKFLDEAKSSFDAEYLIKSFSLEMINTKDYAFYTGEIVFDKSLTFLTKIVRFEKAKIYIKNDVQLIFNGQQKVEFVNCEIIGNERNAIQITNSEEVNIVKCTFKNFKHRVMHLSNIPKILIKDSSFFNCGYYYRVEKSHYGGVFVFRNTTSEITNCVFDGCYVETAGRDWYNHVKYRAVGFSSYYVNSNSNIISNVYNNCYCNNQGDKNYSSYIINDEKTCKIKELNNAYKN